MGSDHFPIQISLDKPLKRNTPLTEPCYRFDKTDDDLLHNTLKDSLTNFDINITTQDELEELAVTLCDKLMKAVDSSTPKSYSRNNPKSPISQAILDLIKEKRRLRRLYNSTQDPNTKSTINKLLKEIRTKINQEPTVSWEKFCNSISLESDSKQSWHKITNFLKPKSPRSYPTLKLGNKTAKTNPEKANSLPKVSKETSALRVICFESLILTALITSWKPIHIISHHWTHSRTLKLTLMMTAT